MLCLTCSCLSRSVPWRVLISMNRIGESAIIESCNTLHKLIAISYVSSIILFFRGFFGLGFWLLSDCCCCRFLFLVFADECPLLLPPGPKIMESNSSHTLTWSLLWIKCSMYQICTLTMKDTGACVNAVVAIETEWRSFNFNRLVLLLFPGPFKDLVNRASNFEKPLQMFNEEYIHWWLRLTLTVLSPSCRHVCARIPTSFPIRTLQIS